MLNFWKESKEDEKERVNSIKTIKITENYMAFLTDK